MKNQPTTDDARDLKKYEARHPEAIPQAETGLTPLTPAGLLEIAVNQGADLDKLEKLMDLQDRWEKTEARKAYVAAMTEFKKNPPEILKQTAVSYKKKDGTTTNYKHASLDHVTEQINIALSEHGLFVSWSQSQSESGITVTCRITHKGGHSEETSLVAASDMSGNKNAIQGLGSTISYLQRYTILSLTGLAAKGMDDDGIGAGKKEPQFTTENQKKKISKLFERLGISDEKDIKKRLAARFEGITDLNEVYVEAADTLIRSLEKMVELKKEDAKTNANN